jgi:nitrogen fixation NifU-like protein
VTDDNVRLSFENGADRLDTEIMEQMRRVYSETAIDYAMNPRNMGKIEKADGRASITGPCGDTMEIFINVRDEIITDATFRTDGCGTSIASGGMVTELAKGKPVQHAYRISQQDILKALGGLPEDDEHCALLAANTMRLAVHDYLNSRSQPWKRMYRTY